MRSLSVVSVSYASLFTLASVLMLGCPAHSDALCDKGTCVDPDGGGGKDADGSVIPVDDCLTKPDAPECLNDDKALFVSPNGNDGDGVGTKARPFKTIAGALAKLTTEQRRIYICEGTYAENVELDSNHNGVSLLGGFDCNWAKNDAKPKVGNGTSPLKIKSANGIGIADLAFEAKDAVGGNSIAAFVDSSTVTFQGVKLTAGNAAKGNDGTLSPHVFPTADQLKGNDAVGSTGGAAKPITCPGGAQTVGGKGGNYAFDGESGTPGPSNGGTQIACAGAGTPGGFGANATNAASALGAASLGELAADGWKPSNGGDGANGAPGQGGGGGGGAAGANMHGGGGGGAGGCGGQGGHGGQGGGASIALLAFNANVTTSTSELTAKSAGAGGAGVAGQNGQAQGGFSGVKVGGACNGGNGGAGGNGGTGGGGAGGVSVGVFYKGPKPTLDATTVTKGTAGLPGGGPGNPGVPGIAEEIAEAP